MFGRLKYVRNGVKIFGRLSARDTRPHATEGSEGTWEKRVWSAVVINIKKGCGHFLFLR